MGLIDWSMTNVTRTISQMIASFNQSTNPILVSQDEVNYVVVFQLKPIWPKDDISKK